MIVVSSSMHLIHEPHHRSNRISDLDASEMNSSSRHLERRQLQRMDVLRMRRD